MKDGVKWTVFVGEPDEGFQCEGVFDTQPDAEEYAELREFRATWWTLPIQPIQEV